ncbi:MAG: DnaJ domain-containing protein [Sorangiineae bacterium]|nr:DnaJ domain-containing protein [Polyangiaceae bacterium]MEB2322607.1 DnaJ domain-containing protein [Sorangiineae bacterium]
MSDASAEAERLTTALRARGYVVVDVPLSLLASRVTVQRPSLILCDVDAPDALGVVGSLREVPGASGVDLIFIGQPGGVLEDRADAVFHEGSGFFVRPVDTYALLRKVEALIGSPSIPGRTLGRGVSSTPSLRPSFLQPASGSQRAASSNPPRRLSSPPPSRASMDHALLSAPPSEAPDSVRSGLPPAVPLGFGMEPDAPRARLVRSIPQSSMSPDLERLLARAEQRVASGSALPLASPSAPERLAPADEVEAVLPADVLAALDEPLSSDEDDDDDSEPGSVVEPGTHGGSDLVAVEPPAQPMTEPPVTPPAVPARPPRPPSWAPPSASHAGGTMADAPPSVAPAPAPAAEASTRPPVAAPVPRATQPSAVGLAERVTAPPRPTPREAPRAPLEIPSALAAGDALRALARVVRARYTGALVLEDESGIRRAVMRDGDFVTVASGLEDESLVAFLRERGAITPEVASQLGRKIAQFGRHAGAALIAHGHLQQDELWPVLRGHAEWLLARVIGMTRGAASTETDVPARLQAEPAVFGGATGAEVLLEVVRRAVPPGDALRRLGGERARIDAGPAAALLPETALPDVEATLASRSHGATVRELIERAPSADFATVLYALTELGVLSALEPAGDEREATGERAPFDELDEEALRARIAARGALVDEGDYFAILGVARGATSYDIKRAYLELRRAFEPSRILTAKTADLREQVDTIREILDEAYDILRDPPRRERYRRALEAPPR